MRIWLALLLLALSGCSYDSINERLSTPQERAFAAETVAVARKGDVAALAARSDPAAAAQFTPELIRRVAATIPPGEPALRTVSVESNSNGGITNSFKAFNYEVGSGNRWAVVQLVVQTAPGKLRVMGLHVQPFVRPPSGEVAFGFEGKGVIHYGWIAAMVAALLLSLTAAVLAIRTRGVRYRWLWALGSLFSFATFSLNWANGAWIVSPISFLVLGAAAFQQGPFAPWVLKFAIPVIAIVFLIRRATGVYRRRELAVAEVFEGEA